MAKAESVSPIAQVHGKTKKDSPGYFYVDKAGNQFYRDRVEGYQRTQTDSRTLDYRRADSTGN